jgi:hypothetical protein
MDNQTQQIKATADAAEAEVVNGNVLENSDTLVNSSNAATGLGKFKDVTALMQAYTNLEAEFTRRSQRLKELENAIKEQMTPTVQVASEQVPSQRQPLEGNLLLEAALANDEVKNAVIEKYLESAARNKGVQFITGGVNVSAQRRVPSSVKEAGALAKQFLNKREI